MRAHSQIVHPPLAITAINVVVLISLGCSGDRQLALKPPQPPLNQETLSQVPPHRVNVTITDARPAGRRLGETTAAFGAKMGENFASEDVPAAIRDLVINEFKAAGHQLGDYGSRVQVTLHELEAWTDTNPLYWEIIATARMDVTIVATTRTIKARQTKTEFINPGIPQLTEVLNKCLAELGQSLREDESLARALRLTP